MYDRLMQSAFDWCVDFLILWANAWGLTYEELNIWLFVVLHPTVTVVLAVCCVVLWKRGRLDG